MRAIVPVGLSLPGEQALPDWYFAACQEDLTSLEAFFVAPAGLGCDLLLSGQLAFPCWPGDVIVGVTA